MGSVEPVSIFEVGMILAILKGNAGIPLIL